LGPGTWSITPTASWQRGQFVVPPNFGSGLDRVLKNDVNAGGATRLTKGDAMTTTGDAAPPPNSCESWRLIAKVGEGSEGDPGARRGELDPLLDPDPERERPEWMSIIPGPGGSRGTLPRLLLLSIAGTTIAGIGK
jgi:hypothetical protein